MNKPAIKLFKNWANSTLLSQVIGVCSCREQIILADYNEDKGEIECPYCESVFVVEHSRSKGDDSKVALPKENNE